MTTDSNTQIDNFLDSTIGAGGDLTPEQAAQLLSLGIQGDTGAPSPELSSGPAAAPAPTDDSPKPAAQPELTAENAVILAKDGKHTISYDKLVQARETARAAQTEAQTLAAQLQSAQQQLADLQAQAQARADAGQAQTQADTNAEAAQAAIDAGVEPDIFGDFSQEAVVNGLRKLNAASVAELKAEIAALKEKIQPFERQAQQTALSAHDAAIYGAHPDADSIYESQEFAAWKSSLPGLMRAAADQALEKGSSTDVIEVFSAFKAATQQQPPAAAGKGAMTPAEAAKAAIAKAAMPVPASLSDIPGGRVAGTNVLEAMDTMNSHELLSATSNMTAEQIEAWLNAQI